MLFDSQPEPGQFVSLGLFRLELRSDILSPIDISDIGGQDFENRSHIQPFLQNRSNGIRVLEHFFVIVCRTDCDDSLTDTTRMVSSPPHPQDGQYWSVR